MAETTERTEYRVVGEYDGRELPAHGVPCPILHLPAAESWAREFREASYWTNIRVQASNVTRTPWVDLDEQEGT